MLTGVRSWWSRFIDRHAPVIRDRPSRLDVADAPTAIEIRMPGRNGILDVTEVKLTPEQLDELMRTVGLLDEGLDAIRRVQSWGAARTEAGQ
ncbi:hypothetical protein OG579_16890 [Williamsia herbipolensis]|uniref:Uncharacterized protein n=1 Tax=Williamsia herbipolensis TaxID=1603258 RepID=A0AAU4K001_9NOCA|nr:hypothetical protein [Williamsia herbipolensis]